MKKKSFLKWLAICTSLFVMSYTISHLFDVNDQYEWTVVTTSTFVFMGVLIIWEKLRK